MHIANTSPVTPTTTPIKPLPCYFPPRPLGTITVGYALNGIHHHTFDLIPAQRATLVDLGSGSLDDAMQAARLLTQRSHHQAFAVFNGATPNTWNARALSVGDGALRALNLQAGTGGVASVVATSHIEGLKAVVTGTNALPVAPYSTW